jgi:hypothetical protein
MATNAGKDSQRIDSLSPTGSGSVEPSLHTSMPIVRLEPADPADSRSTDEKRGILRRATNATLEKVRALAADPTTRQRVIDGARIVVRAARAGLEADQARQHQDVGSRRIAGFIGAAAAAALNEVEAQKQDDTDEFNSVVRFDQL